MGLAPPLFEPPPEHGTGGLTFGTALLALSAVKGLGFKGIYKLAGHFNDHLGRAFQLPAAELGQIMHDLGIANAAVLSETVVRDRDLHLSTGLTEVEHLAARGITLLAHDQLPPRLREQLDGPRWLFVEGDRAILLKDMVVGVVGTRQPSEFGRQCARNVARSLYPYDAVLVSGLAEGIDDEIHRATLDRNIRNVAFLGHGINTVFPASTASTRERILENGGLIATEYFPDENFQKAYFVQRNRLQAALSTLLIIVEAKASSGTAHTLRFAHKYKRPVLGLKNEVPGIDQLIMDMGHPVIDVSDARGMRQLDRRFRNLSSARDRQMKPVDRVIKALENEISIRDFTPSELHLIQSRIISSATFAGQVKDDD